MARALGASLAGVRFDLAFSSPLARAVRTARLILEAGRPEVDGGPGPGGRPAPPEPELVGDLREIGLGRWEGLDKDEARRLDPGLWLARGRDLASVPPPGGESFADLAARVWPAFDRIAERLASGEAERILVVAHQAVNRVILARERGIALDRVLEIGQPPGAVAVLPRPPAGRRR
jgi:probable phosphoglycerate mutase